jgi:hypothetical protein
MLGVKDLGMVPPAPDAFAGGPYYELPRNYTSNHALLFIPAVLDGKPNCLKTLLDFVKEKGISVALDAGTLAWLNDQRFANTSVSAPRWVLVPRMDLEAWSLNDKDQQAKIWSGYTTASAVEVFSAMLMDKLSSGHSNLFQYTYRCSDLSNSGDNVTVGRKYGIIEFGSTSRNATSYYMGRSVVRPLATEV